MKIYKLEWTEIIYVTGMDNPRSGAPPKFFATKELANKEAEKIKEAGKTLGRTDIYVTVHEIEVIE